MKTSWQSLCIQAFSLSASLLIFSGCMKAQLINPATLGKLPSAFNRLSIAPAQLVLSGAATFTAGDCSLYTISQKDAFGNLANASSGGTLVNLTGSASSVFYSDAACTTSITSISIPAGSSSAIIYMKDTKAEILALTAYASDLTSSSLPVAILAGPPSKLMITGNPGFLMNGCDYGHSVVSTDTYGNPSPLASTTTITLSGNGSGTFYSSTFCSGATSSISIAAGTSSANFTFMDHTPEALTWTASASGLADGVMPLNSQTELFITGSPAITEGACSSAITVTSKDWGGFSVVPVSVDTTFTISDSGFTSYDETFYSDASCTTAIGSNGQSGTLTIPTGSTSVTFYMTARLAATAQLSVHNPSQGSSASSALAVAVQPQTPTQLTIAGPSFVQPNTCSAPYSVSPVDVYNNLTRISSSTSISLSTSGAGAFYSDAACTNPISTITVAAYASSAQFYFRDPSSEMTTLTASSAGTSPGNFLADISSASPTILASMGGAHGCAIIDGAVKCWGEQQGGVLGNNSLSSSLIPVQVSGITSGATAISSADSEEPHTCAIVNGGAMCWGQNTYGSLGTGSNASETVPSQVFGLTSGVTAITTGGGASCAIVDGEAMCWGLNSSGQLGNGSTTNSNVPVAVQGLSSGVTAIAIGNSHACAVVHGAVKCWGSNANGELGNGTSTSGLTLAPMQVQGLTSGVTGIAVGREFSCAIVNGGVQCWGNYTGNSPVSVGGLSGPVTSLAATNSHACAVDNGTAKCWSANTSPLATAVTNLTSNVQSITLGGNNDFYFNACAVTDDGIQCWGDGEVGQFGTGTRMPMYSNTPSFPPLN